MLIENNKVDRNDKWVIFDLEDTISEVTEERKKLAEEKKWDEYYSSCITDDINTPVLDLVKEYKEKGFNIGILTGRVETYSEETLSFLKTHEVPFDVMKMRAEGNRIPDKNWKPSAIKKYFSNEENNNIELVVDDRDVVLENLQNKGFKTLDAKTVKVDTVDNDITNYLKSKTFSDFEYHSSEDSFVKSQSLENRYVGFLKDNSIIHIEESELEELGKSYQDIVNEYPDIKFYKQRIGENLEISHEDNLNLIEKHEEAMKRQQIIKNKNTSKTTKSIRKHI